MANGALTCESENTMNTEMAETRAGTPSRRPRHAVDVVVWSLVLGLWLCLAGFAPAQAQANGPHFYFVQITDTHFGSPWENETARAFVDTINALPMPIECVVHTGDVFADHMGDPAVLATGTSTLARLKAPLHVLAGNHDILTNDTERLAGIFTNAFGALSGRAEHQGVVFIWAYTEPLRGYIHVSGYDPLTAVEKLLVGAGDKPVIILHHNAGVEDFHNNAFFPGWPEKMHRRWEALISRPNVKAVITGHFHRDELHWIGSIPVFVGEPAASYWGRQPAFRIYEYKDGRVGYRTVYKEAKKRGSKEAPKKTDVP
jgi:predicted phosphodiesterase